MISLSLSSDVYFDCPKNNFITRGSFRQVPTRRVRLFFVTCAYSDLRDIFSHNFRGLNGFHYRKGWHPAVKQ